MKIYLGSQSPRRKELLEGLGYDFEVVKIDCEEIYPENTPIYEVAAYLSRLKAMAFRPMKEDEVLVTADTVVAFGNNILGKPKNEAAAREMLILLSGAVHRVYTAISIKTSKEIITETDVADVELLPLTTEEIDYYIKNFQPFDKAGAYAIQEWLGMAKILKINGSFYTIMGLPTALLYTVLNQMK